MNVPKKRKIWPIVLVSALCLVLALSAGVIWLASTCTLEIHLNGDAQVNIPYGERYTEQGATAVFTSHVLGQLAHDIPVEIGEHEDVYGTGMFTISYSASYLWLDATAVRTLVVEDKIAPVITLVTDPDAFTLPGQAYQEEGYTAYDNCDGDITDRVQRTVTDTEVIYTVTDNAGNRTEVRRTIVYKDPELPVLTLTGDKEIKLTAGATFTEPGYTATDNVDGDLTAKVVVTGSVDVHKAGTYTLTYTVTDSFGNTVSATRTVTVEAIQPPEVVNPGSKIVYLTFDDGPCAYTKTLLDVLAKYNVKATFFVVDKGKTNNKIMQRIVAEGHAIGVHSLTHEYSEIYASKEAYFADFNAMRQIIYDQTGVWTNLLRFPGGSSNGVSKKYCAGIMTELTQAVTDMGYRYFDWNVSSGDAGDTKTAEGVYQNVISGIKKHDVSFVLQHDIKKYSVEAVEKIIIWCLDNGYTFKALDETSPTCHHKVNN